MYAHNGPATISNGWLGFELSVLRRLRFSSVAMPFSGEPDLGVYLKRWKVRVAVNDPTQWAWTKSCAFIENNSEMLSAADVETVLYDAYVPPSQLSNPSLLRWFNEVDACWFDNVRENAERLATPRKRALALTLGMMVGDYVLSFDEETTDLRKLLSLSEIFRRLWQSLPPPVDNLRHNQCSTLEAATFLATRETDLLFLRLPRAVRPDERRNARALAWREEWVRRGNTFWTGFDRRRAGQLGARVETRQQYLELLNDLLKVAAHLPLWAIEATDGGFLSTDDLVECVNRVKKVDAIYSKDFSELLGTRAMILTASG